jgi:predicted dehydrogenase
VSERAPLPVGVVGVGSLGFHHARLLREVPGARMVGVFDVDGRRATEVSEQLGVRAFRDVDELLREVEGAVIAVPTTEHAGVALRAIDQGVGLLIEKPLARTVEEADRILEAAERAGVFVATGHVERYNSALRAIEGFLESPAFIETHRLAPFGPRGTDVAVVLDLMIHDIDLVLALMRGEVEAVDAVGVPVLTPSVDIANARLRFRGGAAANITASRVSRERMRKIRFFQPSGYISLDLAAGTGEYLRLRRGAATFAGGEIPTRLDDLVERVEIRGDGKEPLRAELEAWVAALRGEDSLVVTGAEGRRALAVALEIVRKIESNVTDPHAS